MLSDFNRPDYPNPSPNLNQTHTTVFLLIRAIQRVWFYDILFALLIPRRTTARRGAGCAAKNGAARAGGRRADPGADVWFEMKSLCFRTNSLAMFFRKTCSFFELF